MDACLSTVLDVVHRVLKLAVYRSRRDLCGSTGRDAGCSVRRFKQFIHVHTLSSAENVGVIGGRTNAHSLCGSSKQITHLMCNLFQIVCGFCSVGVTEDFVQQHSVMCRAGSACKYVS